MSGFRVPETDRDLQTGRKRGLVEVLKAGFWGSSGAALLFGARSLETSPS